MAKIAILLHAEPGTHDSMGRATHGLLYSKELHETGHEVRLIFDGGGTGWAVELDKEDNPLHPLFKAVRDIGLIAGACDYCIEAFGVDREKVQEAKVSTVAEYMGHPSVAKLIAEGYQVITL